MLNFAVVDDDIVVQDTLGEYIKQYCSGKQLNYQITCFDSGFDFLEGYKPSFDIVFMDIDMPHFDGLVAAKKLRLIDGNICLIFVTNMSQYAIKGYEVDAFDFIIKPVEYFNFSKRLDKAIKMSKRKDTCKIAVPVAEGSKIISSDEIYFIEVIKHKVIYHTERGIFEDRVSLKDVRARLENANFSMCNRCYLVNLKHVGEIRNSSVVVGGEELQIGRPRKKEFLNELTEYLVGGRNA